MWFSCLSTNLMSHGGMLRLCSSYMMSWFKVVSRILRMNAILLLFFDGSVAMGAYRSSTSIYLSPVEPNLEGGSVAKWFLGISRLLRIDLFEKLLLLGVVLCYWACMKNRSLSSLQHLFPIFVILWNIINKFIMIYNY